MALGPERLKRLTLKSTCKCILALAWLFYIVICLSYFNLGFVASG
jgi:hypothetical protein